MRKRSDTEPATARSTILWRGMAGGFPCAVRRPQHAAARRGRKLRVMFADKARLGRMGRPRPCWAAQGILPARSRIRLPPRCSQPKGCNLRRSDRAFAQHGMLQDFSAKKWRRQFILLLVDGAGNHHSDGPKVPDNVTLHLLPPYSAELTPRENSWDEIAGKIFKNDALKSLEDVCTRLSELHSTSNATRRS
jgi:hypothetical protein